MCLVMGEQAVPAEVPAQGVHQLLQKILEVLDGLGGTQPDDEMRKAVAAAMCDSAKRKDETLRQYVQRRQQHFDQAAQHEVMLPIVARGFMLKDGVRPRVAEPSNSHPSDPWTRMPTGLLVTRAPTRQFAGAIDFSAGASGETGADTDEEVFVELERLHVEQRTGRHFPID